MSKSVVSEDGNYFYSFIYYDGHFLYHTLKVSDGNQLTSGLKRAIDGESIIEIKELTDYVIVISESLSELFRFHLIDPMKSTMVREFSQSVFFLGTAKHTINGGDYLILAGSKSGNLYVGKIYKNNLAEYGELANVTSSWSKIGSDYDIRGLTSIPAPSTPSVTVTNTTSGTASINDMTGVSPIIEEHVALWIEDFNKTYLPNNKIEIKSIWA